MADDGGRPADREVNHLELVSRWAEDLAHQIKNPFHALVINLELVKRRAGDREGVTERAEVVESEIHRVHELVDSLLAVVRPWPETDTADVDRVFDALLPVVRARASLRLIAYQHEPGGGTVAMPPADLALVILNLVDNAMDAFDDPGRIRTRCAREDHGTRITVADDGSGLGDVPGDPFERGVTGRPGRAGLGLAVTRTLVRRAGGSVAITAHDDGPGVTVEVTLPAG